MAGSTVPCMVSLYPDRRLRLFPQREREPWIVDAILAGDSPVPPVEIFAQKSRLRKYSCRCTNVRTQHNDGMDYLRLLLPIIIMVFVHFEVGSAVAITVLAISAFLLLHLLNGRFRHAAPDRPTLSGWYSTFVAFLWVLCSAYLFVAHGVGDTSSVLAASLITLLLWWNCRETRRDPRQPPPDPRERGLAA